MGFTTFLAVVIGTIGIAAARGHATPSVIFWIVTYNVFGLMLGYALSVAAK